MTSERGLESRPPPEWAGDVGLGVAAWTGGRSTPAPTSDASSDAQPATGPPPEDPVQAGPDADPESVARTILLDALTGRARSRRELADRLARKDVPDEIATRLLDRFTEVGLIDDAAFARQWISARQSGKGLARRALAQELRHKGIDDEVAREALDEIDADDEDAAARRLVRKRLRSVASLDRDKATRRLVGMLARKGYPPGVAFAIVRDELDRTDEDVDDLE